MGRRFGRLTVVAEAAPLVGRDGRASLAWLCKCDCGNTKVLRGSVLRRSRSNDTSCGCRKGVWNRTHLATRTPEYRTWQMMRRRCQDKSDASYRNYGGRGIKVCAEWASFEAFLRDMGKRPTPRHSIDRIDNNGHYEPSNCRWATKREQSNNRRSNVVVAAFGKAQNLRQWCDELGLEYDVVRQRVVKLGWAAEKALSAPKRKMASRGNTFHGHCFTGNSNERG